MNKTKLTYFEAALRVLRETKRPMTTRELTHAAIASGLITPIGKTPEATMSATLYEKIQSDARIKKLGEQKPGMSRAGHGTVQWELSDPEEPIGSDADPLYIRVADDIAARIASGELVPGAQLQTERDFARDYDVSYGTVRHAFKLLRDRGLIESVHGRGVFVRST
jgi:hypothetical protein